MAAAFVVDLPATSDDPQDPDMAPLLHLTRTSSFASTKADDLALHNHTYRLHRDYILPADSCERHATYKRKLQNLKNILTPSLTSLTSFRNASTKHRPSIDTNTSSGSRNTSKCTTPTDAVFALPPPALPIEVRRSSLKDRFGEVGVKVRGVVMSQREKLQTDPEEKEARKAARKAEKEEKKRVREDVIARMSVEARDEFGIPYGHYDWRLGLAYCF